jgi:ubiquinone/menaquinone biosynthesis C-methylase UbiE
MSHERRFDPKSVHKLEAPERGMQFPVDAILDAAGVCAGAIRAGAMNVADIGAGSGYFTLPMARRVAPGKVYAVDPSTELLEVIRGKLAVDGAPENVELVVGEASDTGLAEGACDLIFLSAVWHEIDSPADALREFARIAAPRARLAIVDWSPGGIHPPGPPLAHRVARAEVERALRDGGWSVVKSEMVTEWTYLVVGGR